MAIADIIDPLNASSEGISFMAHDDKNMYAIVDHSATCIWIQLSSKQALCTHHHFPAITSLRAWTSY